MHPERMQLGSILALGLIYLSLFQPLVTTLTRHIPPTPQKNQLTHLPKNKGTPSTLQGIKQHTEWIPPHRSPPHETRPYHHEHHKHHYLHGETRFTYGRWIIDHEYHHVHHPSTAPRTHQHKIRTFLHENHQKDSSTTTLTSDASVTYWVEAGGNGNGTSDVNPAGNITYVLNNLTSPSTYDTIKVQPGTYNRTIESFPLQMNTAHVSLTATTNASTTIIYGTGNTTGIEVTTSNITINGFTIKHHANKWYDAAILLNGSSNTTITGNTITNNGDGIRLWYSNHTTITG
ncbi:MAG: hypothetical protein GWO20_19405, partial [Candidatus Korarchaeota archaeon]|nr:hypothetical protein [Candidatus Korarchaeota archaeon]NIU85421.1 hypothetical protein [Candidatus Thorarchaeota archaeon]NIW15518.1 hypothetical protein [Candidatus Thorarchaeota archaeon]NIW53463.1 hypothetical protein [Candidatus Korarchaeota archaeon]